MSAMTVAAWLREAPRPAATVAEDADVAQMLARLAETRARHLWVVDRGGRYLGHVDVHELAQIVLGAHLRVRSRRALTDRRVDARARDLADAHVRPASSEDPLDLAIERMLVERVDGLPVVDAADLVVGELRLDDLLAGASRIP